MAKNKIGSMPLDDLQALLIRLFAQHGDAKQVQADLGISQSRLSELIKMCGLRRVTHLERCYKITEVGKTYLQKMRDMRDSSSVLSQTEEVTGVVETQLTPGEQVHALSSLEQ